MIDSLPGAFREWAGHEGSQEIVRISPGLIRLKARLAREEARQTKVRSVQRWTLSLVALADLASILWLRPMGGPDLHFLTLGGLLPLLLAPVLFTTTVVWLLED